VAGCVCLRCLVVLPASKDRRLGFLLGLQGEWFSDTAGLGDCGGDLACIVAALRYCVDYVAAL
jgi:hypothetical protein